MLHYGWSITITVILSSTSSVPKRLGLSLKLTHHVMHKESGGEGELVQWLTVETAHIVMGLEGSNSSDIPMTQSCVKDGSLK